MLFREIKLKKSMYKINFSHLDGRESIVHINTVLGKASETTVIKYIHPGPKEEISPFIAYEISI